MRWWAKWVVVLTMAGVSWADEGAVNTYVSAVPREPALTLRVGDTDFWICVSPSVSSVEVGVRAEPGYDLRSEAVVKTTPEAPAEYVVRSETDRELEMRGSIRLVPADIDLDVDSDNTSPPPTHAPERNAAEDRIEDDPETVGRILVCATGDADVDGVPDWADFTNAASFVKVVLDVAGLDKVCDRTSARVRFDYEASNPALVGPATNAYALPPSGALRLWTVDGPHPRNTASVLKGGHFIPAGVDIPVSQLDGGGGHPIELYVEAMKSGSGRIVATATTDQLAALEVSDAVRVRAVRMDLVPDRNQDRQINAADRALALRRPIYRYWTNNDQDVGVGAARFYMPDGDCFCKSNEWNAANAYVDGMRDLLDFFPVHVDVGEILSALNGKDVRVFLRQEDWAVNLLPSSLTPANAGQYLTDHLQARKYMTRRIDWVSNRGTELEPEVFTNLTAGTAVVLLEGRRDTRKPLMLEVRDRKTSTVIARAQMPLQLSSTMDMMRWIDLQLPGGEMRSDMKSVEPPNWPDRETNHKHIVFIHGFMEDDASAPGHASAMFKRLFWAGSRSPLTAVRWTSTPPVGTAKFCSYQHGVTNAMAAGVALRERLPGKDPKGKTIIMAHSLGNIVASECIKGLDKGRVDDYVLLNAAVAAEAYMPETVFTLENSETTVDMVHPAWHQYSPRLRCSEWYRLFALHDRRHDLTWRGYFVDVPEKTRMWNYYSSGENVLQVAEPTFGIFTVAWRNILDAFWCDGETGRLSWQAQEIGKGEGLGMDRLTRIVVGFGGWAFTESRNYQRDGNLFAPAEADQLPNTVLRTVPFFRALGRGAPARLSYLYKGVSLAGVRASNEVVDQYFPLLLARMIPATSHPTGSGGVGVNQVAPSTAAHARISKPKIWEMDMQPFASDFDKDWPRTRGGWWHRDHRRLAYQFVHKVFDLTVKNLEGGEAE